MVTINNGLIKMYNEFAKLRGESIIFPTKKVYFAFTYGLIGYLSHCGVAAKSW